MKLEDACVDQVKVQIFQGDFVNSILEEVYPYTYLLFLTFI